MYKAWYPLIIVVRFLFIQHGLGFYYFSGSRLEDADSRSAVEILIDSVVTFTSNVELLEHISYAISTLVALKGGSNKT